MSPITTPRGHAHSSSLSSVRPSPGLAGTQSPEAAQDVDRRTRSGARGRGSKGSNLIASSPSRMRSRDASRDSDPARIKYDTDSRGRSALPETAPITASPSDGRTSSPGLSPAPNNPRYTLASMPRLGPSRKQSSHSAHDLLRPNKIDAEGNDVRSGTQDFTRTSSLRNLRQGSMQSTHSTPGSGQKSGNAAQEEKKGFFKRMFGSSSSRSNLAIDNAQSGSPAVSRNASIVTPVHLRHAERDVSPAPVASRELNKKSSFFRRKKKSISESQDIPQLPVQNMMTPDPAGTARSSLYRAMDEYLAADAPPGRPAPLPPRADDSASNISTEGDPTLFHSGYTGSPTDNASRSATPNKHSASLADTQDTPTRQHSSAAENVAAHSRSASIADSRISVGDEGSITPRNMSHSRSRTKSSTDIPVMSARHRARHQGSLLNASAHQSEERNLSTGDDVFATPAETPTHAKPMFPASSEKRPDAPDDLGLTYHEADTADVVPDMQEIAHNRDPVSVPRNMSVATASTSLTSATALLEQPTPEDNERAQSIFSGSDDIIPRAQAAAYLGERKTANMNTLRVFMNLFNFRNQTILGGLRMLCNQIILKAESQQVDRILVSFANRWCDCNPNHGFMLRDVVHTMCYSLLLLNTDMHMADIESKMTRSQFVKNTLPTIKRVVAEASPGALQASEQASRPGLAWQDSASSAHTDAQQADSDAGTSSRRLSTDSRRPTLTKRMSWSFGVPKLDEEDKVDIIANSGSTSLVNERFDGKPTEWHYELETILKSFFTAIKNEALPLNKDTAPKLRRANSIKSMAPSEMSMKSRKTGLHSVSGRWGNRSGRPKMYASSQYASSRTSFDDGSSVFSHAAASSAWSKLSLGKTMTTMSTGEPGYHLGPDQGYPVNIGFANALSQINAREDGVEDDNASINPQKFLLEDDTLELAGAPWAKEGMVKHKHHLETTDKKAKERNWNECFAVIERGYLRLFSFNSKGGKTGSLGVRKTMQRGKPSSLAPSIVGGGNWTANAEQLGSFLLRQTIASALPPPGYSKARPHVWALSLPSGAVHLFQVGTPEIATEFMKTANYWSARLSKEPLMGGVENTEYGWSDTIIMPSLIHPALLASATSSDAANNLSAPEFRPGHRHGVSASNSMSMPRASISGSIRSGMDAVVSQRSRLPGDKAHIEDWKPPAQSMMASQLMEVDQLKALKDYVAGVEADLSKHNELRSDIPSAFSPRHPNAAKAISNWEKKSAYLLREIVKFRTYIDALNMAQEEKTKFDADRAEREKEKEERERRKEERKRKEAESILAEEGDGVATPVGVAGQGSVNGAQGNEYVRNIDGDAVRAHSVVGAEAA